VYTQQQLLAMFNQSPGSGGNANALLILVDQLITAKLNKCNIAQCNGDVAGFGACANAAIAQADYLIGCLTITPCASGPNCSAGFAYVKVSSSLGQQMIAVATTLNNCNNSCNATQYREMLLFESREPRRGHAPLNRCELNDRRADGKPSALSSYRQQPNGARNSFRIGPNIRHGYRRARTE